MPKRKKKTILLVEDDKTTALLETRMLEKHGFSVICVASGDDAVKTACFEPDIDIILMDIDLGPGMDGTRAAEKILQTKDIPVLFLSNHTEHEIVDKTEKITSYGYVVKNTGETVLLASIRMAFKLHEAYLHNRIKSEELEATNEELNATVEELESTNEEFQVTIDELENTKQDLESLLTQHKEAEERLAKSEAAFRNLFEATPSGVGILMGRKFVQINAVMCTITGYREDELINQSASKLFIDAEEFFRVGRELYSTIKQKGFNIIETRARRKNGAIIDVLISVSPLDPDDDAGGMVVSVQDITRLRHAEEQYKTIIQTAMDGFLIHDFNGRVLDVNDAFCEMTGYSRDELRDMEISDFYISEDPQTIKANLKRIIGYGSERFESYLQKKDGTVIDTEISINHFKRDKNFFFVFTHDITERKQWEVFLQMYRYTIDRATDEIIWQTKDGGFEYVNDQACRMLGYTRDELMELKLWDIDPVFPKERWFSDWEEFQKDRRGGTVKHESMQRRKDGTLFPVDVHAQHLWFGDRELHVAVVRDISEQKKIENDLRESELFLRKSQEAAGIGSYVLETPDNNPRHHTWRGTQEIYKIFGIDEDYPKTGEAWLNLMSNSEDVYKYMNRQYQQKSPEFNVEFQIIRPRDGEKRWVQSIGEYQFDREGNPVRAIGTMQDITERKASEELLIQERDFIRDAIDSLPGIFYILDDKGLLKRWNKNLEIASGYSAEELKMMNPLELAVKEERTFLQEHREKLFKEGSTFVKLNLVSKNGNITPYLFSGMLYYIDNRPHVIGMAIDISEKIEIEERYQAILKTALDGFAVVTTEGDITDVNDAYCAMTGYSREELVMMKIWDADLVEDVEKAHKHIEQIITTGAYRFETVLRTKSGGSIEVEVGSTHFDKAKEYFYVFLRDITDQKKANMALEHALDEKENLLRELQHRVKNNLSMITGIIELETDNAHNTETQRALDNLKGRILSMTSLYELLFQAQSFTTIQLDEYIHAIAQSLTRTYISDNSALSIQEDCDTYTVSSKDAAAWGLIVNELLTNALKYAFPKKEEGIICIRFKNSGKKISLTVSDNGTGPPAGFSINGSVGFGLLLARMLAKQLGGALAFQRGKENTFAVEISETYND